MSARFINQVVGAGADIDVQLGFAPKSVVVRNLTNGNKLEWVEGMLPGTSMLTTAADGVVATAKQALVWARTTADLTFTAVAAGPYYISVAVVDGGATGDATLAKTGSGTKADPYLYTFTIYDDHATSEGDGNSNDQIISLLSGDEHLAATGSESADETAADPFAVTALAAALGVTVRGLDDTAEQTKGLGFVLGQAVGINAAADENDVLVIEAVRGDVLL